MRPGSMGGSPGGQPASLPAQGLRHKAMRLPARALLAVYDPAVFYLCLAEFVLLSLTWSLLASLLRLLLPQRLGQRVGRLGVMLSCRLFLATLTLSVPLPVALTVELRLPRVTSPARVATLVSRAWAMSGLFISRKAWGMPA